MKASPALMVLLLGLAPGLAGANETWREQSRRTVPSTGLTTVAVENSRGRIEVRPSPDADLHLTAVKIARAPRLEDAKDMARQTVVELVRDGGRYLVRVRYPRGRSTHVNLWEGFGAIGMPRIEVRVTVDVPQRMGVDLVASSGDLYSHGLTGPQSLRASSGDVSVEDSKGSLEITTSSGDVSVRDIAGARISSTSGDVEVRGAPARLGVTTSSGDVSIAHAGDSLRIETSSGDMTVDRAGRGVTIRTTSGEIQLGAVSGQVSISSSSGDVVAAIVEPLAEASILTSSGDIRLGLADRVGCHLELRTTSGSLDVDVPLRPTTLTRRAVSGSVRGGSAPVSLRTQSGSIAIVTGEP